MKEKLKKYRSVSKEIDHLEAELRDTGLKATEVVSDVVKDYRTGYGKPIVIEGIGSDRAVKLAQKLANKRGQLIRERLEIEEWLDNIDDSELRDILRLQYIQGMTIEEAAQELGYSERTIKYRLEKIWKK